MTDVHRVIVCGDRVDRNLIKYTCKRRRIRTIELNMMEEISGPVCLSEGPEVWKYEISSWS